MENLKQQLAERLTSLEDAYKETGRPTVDSSVYPEDLQINRAAGYNAIVLVEAARKIERENGSGEIDWSNPNQRKYIPWFIMSPASFAFDCPNFGFSYACAGSGSRLWLLTEAASDYLAETFPGIWEKVQLG